MMQVFAGAPKEAFNSNDQVGAPFYPNQTGGCERVTELAIRVLRVKTVAGSANISVRHSSIQWWFARKLTDATSRPSNNKDLKI